MEVIIKGHKQKNGPDCDYDSDVEMRFRIDNDADMIFNLDGKDVFKCYCLDVLKAVRAFDI